MPTVDFFFKAARVPLTHPYELKRLRHGSGEAVDYMLAGDAGSYGVYPLVRRQWRIIRVTNCTLADAQMVCGPEALSVDDIGKGFLARRRVWRLPLGNYPAMATRKAPDVDDPVFAGIRDAMLAAFPQLADVPLANRRQTIYDVQITRAQFIAALILRPNEPRDLSGQPTEAVEPDYTIDIQE
jgi:hypothetical protein